MTAASQRFPYKGCCSGNTDTIMSSGRQCIERLALTARLTVKGQQKALSQSNIVKDQTVFINRESYQKKIYQKKINIKSTISSTLSDDCG